VDGGTTGADVGSIGSGCRVVGVVVVVIGTFPVGSDDGDGAVGGRNGTSTVGAAVLLVLGTCEVPGTTDGDGDTSGLL
jgi:hypothetical protein